MEDFINDPYLIDKLKLISKIKEGDKIIIKDQSIKIDNRYFQSLRRWYNNDNRYLSIIFIENAINNALELEDSLDNIINLNNKSIESKEEIKKLTKIQKKSIKDYLNNLSNELNNAIEGLKNIKTTYILDKLMQEKLDVLISKIDISYKE